MKIMYRASLIISIIASVFISTSAFATNGMRLIGFGPIQNSMGGVSVGLPLDAAAVLTNPAGMSALPGRIDFGASYFKPSVEYKATEAPGMGGMVIGSNEKTIDSDRGASPIPAFGLILPINDRMNFGVGAYGTCGMGVDYAKNLYGGITNTSYSQMRFTPGVSYKINDMFSVGAALNVMYATMEHHAAGGFGQQPHMGASSIGYGAVLGLMVKPIDMLQVGLAYETKSSFQDFSFNTAAGVDKLEFNQPSVATIGLGLKPIEALLIGFDVQWIRWSETNGKDLPKYSQNSSSAMPWNLDWENQLVYKIGLQYTVNPTVSLRAGYNYGKMPLNPDRAFENIAFPAIAEHHFTAGIGIHLTKQFSLNLGGMYSPKATLTGANGGYPPAGQAVSSYETSMSQYSIDMGISYVF
ncbi:MAG: outer membrane protein transport protein [Deltaproteobacteria bacterium]|nr:outer membrane protein transport protein [Deltaproteobacteria bacterium]